MSIKLLFKNVYRVKLVTNTTSCKWLVVLINKGDGYEKKYLSYSCNVVLCKC
jgi:hypothetical protein